MIQVARTRASGVLLLTLLLQSALWRLAPVFSVHPRQLSQSRPDSGVLRGAACPSPARARGAAFLLVPGSVTGSRSGSRRSGGSLAPHKRRFDAPVAYRSVPPAGGHTDGGGGNVFGRIWSTVKWLFGRAEDSANVPMIANLGRLSAAQLSQMAPAQSLRSFQALNVPMALPSVESPPAGPGADASPYAPLVRAQPSIVMTKFLEKAPARVREAVKSTVGALVGSFYRYCVETTMITTAERLSVLIHSMQMTGYMLWNAECRYCLYQQLVGEPGSVPSAPASSTSPTPPAPGAPADQPSARPRQAGGLPHLKEDIIPPYNADSLLWYIKRLPDDTANSLFDNMTMGVLDAMHESTDLAVESLTGVALGQQPQQPGAVSMPRVIVQQTGSSCIQLCFWHLALGYCLRDQEAKIELQNALQGA